MSRSPTETWAVLWRPPTGGRFAEIGRAASYKEAVWLIGERGSGDYHLQLRRADADLQELQQPDSLGPYGEVREGHAP